ncbi:MAG: CPBP family intramembrane glutamic endopeptidase [Eubacteriales bacterium]
MEKRLSLHKIIISLIASVLLWAVVTDAWGYSQHLFYFSFGNYIYAYLSRLIWVLPTALLIFRYSNSLYFNSRQLFSRPCFDKPLAIVLAASLTYVVAEMLVIHGGFWFNKEVNLPLELIKFAMVGFVEETVFRGWGYNALEKVSSDRKAVIISTAFFILLHWPAYFIRLYRFGTFDLLGAVTQSFSALILGVVFCLLLKKGKSLWNPIIAHAFYDIIFVMFVG